MLDFQIFEASEAEKLEQKKSALLYDYNIVCNNNDVKTKDLDQSYLESQQESRFIDQRASADRAATRVTSENEIKRLNAELESQNIDERLFRAKAMDLAVNSLNGKYLTSVNFTSMDDSDAGTRDRRTMHDKMFLHKWEPFQTLSPLTLITWTIMVRNH